MQSSAQLLVQSHSQLTIGNYVGPTYAWPMRQAAAAAVVFIGGFIIMVLEIIGARFLAKDFGSYFHVWVSQIGVVLIALALGYYLGGARAIKYQGVTGLILLLVP